MPLTSQLSNAMLQFSFHKPVINQGQKEVNHAIENATLGGRADIFIVSPCD